MKARSIARELALLGISQLTDNPEKMQAASGQERGIALPAKALDALLMKALKALSADAQETLDTAEGELQRSERLILESETRTVDQDEVRSRIQPAVPLIESAINRAGSTLELLIFAQQGDRKEIITARRSLVSASTHLENGDRLLLEHALRAANIDDARVQIQLAISVVRSAVIELKSSLEPVNFAKLINRDEVRSYACDLLYNWVTHWKAVDTQLNEAMEKWSMRRLARVDRDILRLAMMEIVYMDVPTRVAIDEAIEMAKRYSDEEGYRFINGVLRRATDKLDAAKA
ncbi:MAG: N utilization substance protein NusB [Phormidesmis priestleyi Ana]|uniref:Transcription antitermination protein NusB n=1 Tax=Phormidesmis priestleyi Ana TaxID=1666911 RepID=A0A0P7ZUS0_9CYAN|nr:MAG: N utilization substance protein NusB [Phormidesmis priestleyi Ana]